jgi:hypothetical protein
MISEVGNLFPHVPPAPAPIPEMGGETVFQPAPKPHPNMTLPPEFSTHIPFFVTDEFLDLDVTLQPLEGVGGVRLWSLTPLSTTLHATVMMHVPSRL